MELMSYSLPCYVKRRLTAVQDVQKLKKKSSIHITRKVLCFEILRLWNLIRKKITWMVKHSLLTPMCKEMINGNMTNF